MKILKALMLSLMLTLSFNTFANDAEAEVRSGPPRAAIGEDANGCGPNSTCSECVNQTQLPATNDGSNLPVDAANQDAGAR